MTALACCAGGLATRSFAQSTVPWKVDLVTAYAYVSGGYWQEGQGKGYSCENVQAYQSDSWYDSAGLSGVFSIGASASYQCCRIDGYDGGYFYGYGDDCWHYGVYTSKAQVWIGSGSVAVNAGSCWEYQNCSTDFSIRVVFDRPMRAVWNDCGKHVDCCKTEECPIDGSPYGDGQAEFPGAGAWVYTDYFGYTYVFSDLRSYSFYFGGGAGNFEYADDIRFERMFPADIVPDRIVNGVDLAAILSKWGGPYDAHRTPEDVNLDGQVSAEDLAAVLFAWGTPG